MSLVFGPGVGHLFLGRWKRAIAWSAIIIIAFALAPLPSFAMFGPLLWAIGARIGAAVDVGLLRVLPDQLPRLRVAIVAWIGMTIGLILFFVVVRTFYLEAFKIPASSGSPTLVIGDHIWVKKYNKDIVRGDIVVFTNPCRPNIDFVKRVVALEGDSVEIRCSQLYVNGKPVARRAIDGDCQYLDFTYASDSPYAETTHRKCSRFVETVGEKSYEVLEPPDLAEKIHQSSLGTGAISLPSDFPKEDEPPVCPNQHTRKDSGKIETSGDGSKTDCNLRRKYIVPANHFFVLGDNRPNSSDSRYWGSVPLQNIKGTAASIFWSVSPSDKQPRWDRIGNGL